jgi:myo-inositol-1(or 4)-monophosphatase
LAVYDAGTDRVEVRDRLAAAVREAGALALQTFRGELKSWIKGKSSPVSEADLAVDALLRERLLLIHDAGWLSEETEDDPARLQRADVWVVDPIDGTRAYLAGLPDWAVSVALVHAGRPVVAALYAPVTNELFLSIAGTGATLNGVPIKASTGDRIADAKFSGPKRRLESLATIEPGIQSMPRVPSLALRLARVATGALDGAFAGPDSHDWDLAAADLLVHEAGGLISTVTGQSLTTIGPIRSMTRCWPPGARGMRCCSASLAIGLPNSRDRASLDRGDGVMAEQAHGQQLLHLVFGGELTDLDHVQFRSLDQLDIVGVYPNYATAYAAWKSKAQQTVDNAHMRYFIVHLHRLLDPETDQRAKR